VTMPLKHIRSGELTDGFTAREIRRKGWTHFSDHDAVKAGLELLCDLDWFAEETRATGGHPLTTYRINPAV
jgi:hypothetical protein